MSTVQAVTAPSRLRVFIRPALAWLFTGVAIAGCAHEEILWTPQTVAPPENLASALQEAQPAPSNAAPGKADTTAAESENNMPPRADEAVSLTRDGAILMALDRNRSLAVERYEPVIAATSIQEARASFDPKLTAAISYGESKSPITSTSSTSSSAKVNTASTSTLTNLSQLSQQISALNQAVAALDTPSTNIAGRLDSSTTLSEYLPTGTELFLSGGFTRDSSSVASNDAYSGVWSVGVNQALLQGLGTGVNLANLRQSRNSAASSEQALRSAALDLVRDVEYAYWNLVLARETLSIRQFSVSLSEELLHMNQALISVGKLSESAQVSAEAALASSKANLVDAEAGVRSQTIELWRLLNPDTQPESEIAFTPADPSEVARVELDPPLSIALAERYRPELAQARLSLANRQLEIVRTRNGLLPRLDFSASYGHSSEGDSEHSAARYLDSDAYNNFQLGLSFETSLTYRAERAAYRRAKFQREQAEASVANLEQLIEAEVRQAAIETERQWERIQATEKEVENREEELRVEQDMFRLGRATNLDVLQVQENLISAKLSAVTARIGYIEALTALYHAEGTLLARRGVAMDQIWENAS